MGDSAVFYNFKICFWKVKKNSYYCSPLRKHSSVAQLVRAPDC